MKKRALTLLEIMIVIFLITLITGVIGYNMKGSLDKGKVFRTEQAKDQLRDLLLICLSETGDPDNILKNPREAIDNLHIAKNVDKLLEDGWKQPFEIKLIKNKTDFDITSKSLDEYKKNQQ